MPGQCWHWTAARDELGYGYFRVVTDESMKKAHRVSWELANGEIPDGLVVCHSCDNPSCVNPAHLFLGTLSDNVQDSISKGRWSYAPARWGEASPMAKLSPAQVEEIRSRYAAGRISQRELGDEFGVSQTAISKIVRGVRWRHLT